MLRSIIPTPDIFQCRRILAIQPHYDDNDIGAGGTLAALHDAGAEIFYLTVTDDQMGLVDEDISAEAAAVQLKNEQEQSGSIIGVSQHFWLDYPDAGKYDYYELRSHIIRLIRQLKPDALFAPDPWLPYEAHRDHIQTGHAAAEAACLYDLMRIHTDPAVDAAYISHDLLGVAFYYTNDPNTPVDISRTCERKARAVSCYRAQFTDEDMQRLLMVLDFKERSFAEGRGYSHAEALKVMHPNQLHCGL